RRTGAAGHASEAPRPALCPQRTTAGILSPPPACEPMEYLNFATLDSIEPARYRATRPFPWVSLEGALTDSGYRELLATPPPFELFEKDFGYQRKHGQQSHDRYALNWTPEREPELPAPWVALIHECLSPRYSEFLCRLYDTRACTLRFHWHYTPRGRSV